MSKAIVRMVIRPMLAALVLLALALGGWVGHVSYLTGREDRACGEMTDMIAGTDEEL